MRHFRWTVPPSQAFSKSIYIDGLRAAVKLALDEWAPQIEAYAKRNARWTDRTANARQTLAAFTFVSADGNWVVLVMKQQMDYGVFLELRNGGRYAIVMESLELHYSSVWNRVRQVVQ